VTKKTLSSLGIYTIGDLAASDRGMIARALGKAGEMIHECANGLDQSPVTPSIHGKGHKSMGSGMTFIRDLRGIEDISSAVSHLCDEVSTGLRRKGLKCKTLSCLMKTPEMVSFSRQRHLPRPTNLMKDLRDEAVSLIAETWNMDKPIRSLTITAMNIIGDVEEIEQLSFLEDSSKWEKQEKIEKTMDAIRGKYGKKALSMGISANRDLGLD
jgi:DNA polymerase-4